MIPRKTSCEFVRISNLTQRMTEAEIENFTGRYKLSDIVKTEKGGACLPGNLWNDTIRPDMLKWKGVVEPRKPKADNKQEKRVAILVKKIDAHFLMLALSSVEYGDDTPEGAKEWAARLRSEIAKLINQK